MNTARSAARPQQPVSTPADFEALERVMRDLLTQHEQMLRLTLEHRRAISEADVGALQVCLQQQQAVSNGIVKLERERQGLVARIMGTSSVAPGAPRTTMSQLAEKAPAAVRARLETISKALRELLVKLQRECAALKIAAEAVSSHVEGLLKQVCRTLSHSGTYARSGAVESGRSVVSALDVRS